MITAILIVTSTALFVLLIGAILAGFRLYNELDYYSSRYVIVINSIDNLNSSCCRILENEIYSDEPVVRELIDSIKATGEILYDISAEYYISEEAPDKPEYFKSYEGK